MQTEYGTIHSAIYGEKSLYKVEFEAGNISKFMPALVGRADASMPLQVGMQVLVLYINTESQVILGAVHSNAYPGDADGIGSITRYADGTTIVYDSQSKTLQISGAKELKIAVDGDVAINAAGAVKLNGDAANMGVVTGESICHFTGNPHADCSTKVLAGKQ